MIWPPVLDFIEAIIQYLAINHIFGDRFLANKISTGSDIHDTILTGIVF
jgi:hypothetical protein